MFAQALQVIMGHSRQSGKIKAGFDCVGAQIDTA